MRFKNTGKLTNLQNEFIKNRKNKRKFAIKVICIICIIALILTGNTVLSIYLGKGLFADFTELDNFVYFIIWFISILSFVAIDAMVYFAYRFIIYCICKYRVNNLDFKIRGILLEDEYKTFINSYTINNIKNFNRCCFYGDNKHPSKTFDRSYSELQKDVNVIDKLINAGITKDDFSHCNLRNKKYPAGIDYVALLNNYSKIKTLYNEVTEFKEKGKYNIYYKNWKLNFKDDVNNEST